MVDIIAPPENDDLGGIPTVKLESSLPLTSAMLRSSPGRSSYPDSKENSIHSTSEHSRSERGIRGECKEFVETNTGTVLPPVNSASTSSSNSPSLLRSIVHASKDLSDSMYLNVRHDGLVSCE